MRVAHIALGAAAVVVAGVSGVMISNYLDRAAEQQAKEVATAKEQAKEQAAKERPVVTTKTTAVLVAGAAIDIGDALDGRLNWIDWPDAAVGSITSSGGVIARQETDKPEALKNFVGAVARVPISRGQPVTQDMVVTPGKGSMLSALIHPGMRAITIPIDHTSGVGGMLQPGDFVDIMLTVPLTDQGGGMVDPQIGLARPKTANETIIRGVHILSVDRRMSTSAKAAPGLPDAPPPTTVTLELSEHDANRMTMASQMGRITLALAPLSRKKVDGEGTAGVVTDVQVMPGLRAARAGVSPDKVADLPFLPPAPATPLQGAPGADDATATPKTVTIYRWTTPKVVSADGNPPGTHNNTDSAHGDVVEEAPSTGATSSTATGAPLTGAPVTPTPGAAPHSAGPLGLGSVGASINNAMGAAAAGAR